MQRIGWRLKRSDMLLARARLQIVKDTLTARDQLFKIYFAAVCNSCSIDYNGLR